MPGVFQTSFHQYNGIDNYTSIYNTYGFYKTKAMFDSYRILLMNDAEYFKPEYRLLIYRLLIGATYGSVNLRHIKMAINLI